ncbi:hypothetical protein [Enterococcus avium]|uniref:hypothetical protein n=1 Tax=Enterococcus avium TaxID=33945 RepID=UPI0034D258A5
MANNYLSSDILEVEKLSDLLKNKTQLKESLGYKSFSRVDGKIEKLKNVLNLDFMDSFYDDEPKVFKIPIISFEILKVLLSMEIENFYQNNQEDMNILLLAEMKKNLSNSATTFQRIIYKFILNKWEFILKGNISFDDWKKTVTRLDNKLEKEYVKLGNESQIDSKTKRNYLKQFWGCEYLSSRFEKYMPDERYDLISNNPVQYYFLIESTKFKLMDLLSFCAINQISFEVAYLDESSSSSFFDWLKWIVVNEAKLMKKYCSDIYREPHNEKEQVVYFLELFSHYTPGIMIANQHQNIVSTESRRIKEQNLAFEGGKKSRYGIKFDLKMIDFLQICQSEGINTEENELLQGINLEEVDFKLALCKDYFSLQDLRQFLYKHEIVYSPYTNQVSSKTYKGNNNRLGKVLFNQQMAHYFNFNKLSDDEKKQFSKRLGIEINKMEEYLSVLSSYLLVGHLNEKEIRAQLEEEFIKEKFSIKEKNENLLFDRRNKCRLGMYLLDLASSNSTVEYESRLNTEKTRSKMNPQVSDTWNFIMELIDQGLENGMHLVEIVRAIRSY